MLSCVLKKVIGAGGVAQWLGALEEDRGLVTSTHTRQLTYNCSSGDPVPSSGVIRQPHTCAYTHIQTHIYINKNKLLKANSILSSQLFECVLRI